jgi:hypothetical protein
VYEAKNKRSRTATSPRHHERPNLSTYSESISDVFPLSAPRLQIGTEEEEEERQEAQSIVSSSSSKPLAPLLWCGRGGVLNIGCADAEWQWWRVWSPVVQCVGELADCALCFL